MAFKRRETEACEVPLSKKARVDLLADELREAAFLDEPYASDGSGDYIVNYTKNATPRADSEARRAWDYVCQVVGCGQRFNRPCRLEAHMRSHNSERPFACPDISCDKTFPRKDHLQRHLKNAHAAPDRNFACEWGGCEKTFTSNGLLQRHIKVHESKYYCTGYPPCCEVFRKQKTLDAHVKSTHLDTKSYACAFVDAITGERCLHGYQTEGALRRHVENAHGTREQQDHFCMICIPPGTDFMSTRNETGVVINIPSEPLSFATRKELEEHNRLTHKPLCPQCGTQFRDHAGLKSHVQTVHGDPNTQPTFPCPEAGCGSVFNRKHNLNVHIKSVHENQHRFACTMDAMQKSKHTDLKDWDGSNACNAQFKAKSSLEQHIRTHHLNLPNRKTMRKAAKIKKENQPPSALEMLTGVGYEQGRDVPCLVSNCDIRFMMDRDLRRHLRAVHNVSDDHIETMILERNANVGGAFWIGGMNECGLTSASDFVESSVPQTPSSSHMFAGYSKAGEMPARPFAAQTDGVLLMDDDNGVDMDTAMGLSGLGPAVDALEGLRWDMLAPAEAYNW